jgi:hypothetical protein
MRSGQPSAADVDNIHTYKSFQKNDFDLQTVEIRDTSEYVSITTASANF